MQKTRAERIWGETGPQFCRPWRAFFIRLERMHLLVRDNQTHLWLLHRLFLPLINDDCKRFQLDWNHHPISGPDTKNRSPKVRAVLII